ncbi:MAG TPA: hypothetical protein VGT44_00270 [Ktedonobacteraceae bacterium]|nr:hypothetical protein [Ktedonobacteraceae bacterium]
MTDRTPTFGDLCSAIADGSLTATLNGSMYEVNALELRRYLGKFFTAQSFSFTDSLLAPSGGDAQEWSASTHPSVV